jgi:hypothetical protein
MAATQVVVYFDKQEHALLFTVAASSVMSAGEVSFSVDEGVRVGEEICKATRIKTEGVANIPSRTAPK